MHQSCLGFEQLLPVNLLAILALQQLLMQWGAKQAPRLPRKLQQNPSIVPKLTPLLAQFALMQQVARWLELAALTLVREFCAQPKPQTKQVFPNCEVLLEHKRVKLLWS
jgi:hypothetical protein